jgi:hypothetical protein
MDLLDCTSYAIGTFREVLRGGIRANGVFLRKLVQLMQRQKADRSGEVGREELVGIYNTLSIDEMMT